MRPRPRPRPITVKPRPRPKTGFKTLTSLKKTCQWCQFRVMVRVSVRVRNRVIRVVLSRLNSGRGHIRGDCVRGECSTPCPWHVAGGGSGPDHPVVRDSGRLIAGGVADGGDMTAEWT